MHSAPYRLIRMAIKEMASKVGAFFFLSSILCHAQM
jgi:hypothetical protein